MTASKIISIDCYICGQIGYACLEFDQPAKSMIEIVPLDDFLESSGYFFCSSNCLDTYSEKQHVSYQETRTG